VPLCLAANTVWRSILGVSVIKQEMFSNVSWPMQGRKSGIGKAEEDVTRKLCTLLPVLTSVVEREG
jgi:hypothetical protein